MTLEEWDCKPFCSVTVQWKFNQKKSSQPEWENKNFKLWNFLFHFENAALLLGQEAHGHGGRGQEWKVGLGCGQRGRHGRRVGNDHKSGRVNLGGSGCPVHPAAGQPAGRPNQTCSTPNAQSTQGTAGHVPGSTRCSRWDRYKAGADNRLSQFFRPQSW